MLLTDYEAPGTILGGALRVPGLSLSAISAPGAYDGLLAAGFLTHAPSELDYGAREIRIHNAARVAGRTSSRVYCSFSVAGLPLIGMLDTGFETEVFLNAGLVSRHDLWRRFPAHEEKVFTGAAGRRLVTHVVDLPDLRLGGIRIRSVRATLADPADGGIHAIGQNEAILGASLLKRFSIAFDGSGGLGFRLFDGSLFIGR
jgi:hypothetical protein